MSWNAEETAMLAAILEDDDPDLADDLYLVCWPSPRVFIFTPGARLDLSNPAIDCLKLFRFEEREIYVMCDVLRLDSVVKTRTRLRAHNWEALCQVGRFTGQVWTKRIRAL
jgi:hypothetical protein